MNVLVDTSVWVTHFKQRDERLAGLLEAGMVVCHPHVVVEVACGARPLRGEIIKLLAGLDSLPVATPGELLALIQHRSLGGRVCGLVDVSLLASVLLGEHALLWTLAKRLKAVAAEWGLCYQPAIQS